MDPAIYLLTSVVEIVTLHDIVCNVDLPVPSAAPLRTHQVVSIGSHLRSCCVSDWEELSE